ncbi:MAG: (d)CMP kinase [Treponema sp.]|nr:(d)CMP kinase [Treponema sp.]
MTTEEAVAVIAARISVLLKKKPNVLVAIDGMCASGKSTVAQELSNKCNASIFHADDFFLPASCCSAERLADSGASIDWERLEKEVLEPLVKQQPVKFRKYDCHMQKLLAPIVVLPKHVCIVEGSFSMSPHIERYYDFSVFLKISNYRQVERIMKRNPTNKDDFFNKWIPREENYFFTTNILNRCTLSLGMD